MSRTYPIGGGKGGSGKSFLTANLGVLLAKQGKRVVLVDLDLGGSNLHTFLGLRNPKPGLDDFLRKGYENLDHVAVPTVIPNLFLISSLNCSVEISNLFHAQKLKIIRAIKKLPYDYILLDLGAGSNFNTLDFFLASNEGLFVITPEPTSIENTFHFIKAVYFRKIKQVLKQKDLNDIVRSHNDFSEDILIKSPLDILNILAKHHPEKEKLLHSKLEELSFRFIINQFRKQEDATIGIKIKKVCNKHFFPSFQFLGNIGYDERVHDSIYARNIYMNKYPFSMTAVELQNVAKKITENEESPALTSLKLS